MANTAIVYPPREFGRYYIEDPRDGEYPIRREKTKRTSRYWYDRRWLGDQKETPHCVGFAWAHWLVNAPHANFLDPDGIYTLAKYLDEWEGTDYNGTSVRAGAKVLNHLGLITEYRWTNDLDTLVNTVLTQGPVVVGTSWYESMMLPHPFTRIIEVVELGKRLGGHAWLITGVSTRHKLLRGKNSWGDWGAKGRFWIGFSDMDKLLSEYSEVCLALERPVQAPSTNKELKGKKTGRKRLVGIAGATKKIMGIM